VKISTKEVIEEAVKLCKGGNEWWNKVKEINKKDLIQLIIFIYVNICGK